MEVEDEENVQGDPTDEFITRGMKIGSQSYLYRCKCSGFSFNGKAPRALRRHRPRARPGSLCRAL